AERSGEIEAVEAFHAISEGTLAREDEMGDIGELVRFCDENGIMSLRAARVDNAP
ncbi:MAG: hypothetical protein ACJA16_002019, partial [Akkermansiaceae bacterium]